MQKLCSNVQRQEMIMVHVVHTISSQDMKQSAMSSQAHLISKYDISVIGPRESKLGGSRLSDIRVVFNPRRGENWFA
jgi:hypothetical protein